MGENFSISEAGEFEPEINKLFHHLGVLSQSGDYQVQIVTTTFPSFKNEYIFAEPKNRKNASRIMRREQRIDNNSTSVCIERLITTLIE